MDKHEEIGVHERVKGLEVNVETIMTNHLPHIQARVDLIDSKLWYIMVLLVGNLVAIIIKKFI